MVSKQQKEMKKKKKRAEDSHRKVVLKREKLRAQAKAEKEEWRQEKRIIRLQRDLDRFETGIGVPIEGLPEDTMKQLEHNVEILRALEQEHAKETAEKQQLNEELEKEGHKTMKDKLQALHAKMDTAKAHRDFKKQMAEMGVGGTATCKMSIAPPPTTDVTGLVVPKPRRGREVSDVELVKAEEPREELITGALFDAVDMPEGFGGTS